jgi:plastocyanin
MPKTPYTDQPCSPCDTSRRTVLLSFLGAAVAGLSTLRTARAANTGANDVQVQPASSNVVVVKMNNGLRFVPDVITIKAGTTVEWRNVESYPHSVTADPSLVQKPANSKLPPGAKAFNSGRINGGKSWRHTFTVAGAYHYFCIPHEDAGMLGTVIVT